MERSSPEAACADSALLQRLASLAAAAPSLELLVLRRTRHAS
jgi:hypothetical protein